MTAYASISDADVLLAQFRNGKLELVKRPLQGTDFFAISHVWGADATWLSLVCHDHEVYVSKRKARFIDEMLESLVRTTPFWMDVICINQRNQAAVVGVTKLIPTVFREAQKTIAIRDGDGFYSCCAETVIGCTTRDEISHVFPPHLARHDDYAFEESFLSRLWTLQECLYSRTIQFVSCLDELILIWEKHLDSSSLYVKLFIALDRLFNLAVSFQSSGNLSAGNASIMSFICAYLSLASVTKDRDTVSKPDNVYTALIWESNNGSGRVASKPRDYVLATMNQFQWYVFPLSKTMDFSILFNDLWQQASVAGPHFIARFTASMTEPTVRTNDRWSPSPRQPDPESLGDFLKLFGNQPKNDSTGSICHLAQQVRLGNCSRLDRQQSLHIIGLAMEFSRSIWYESHHGGELALHGSDPASQPVVYDELLDLLEQHPTHPSIPLIQEAFKAESIWRLSDDFLLPNGRAILDAMWCASSTSGLLVDLWEDFSTEEFPQQWSYQMRDALLLMAAMVNCRVPLSAIAWARNHFRPVTITSSNRLPLGLVSRHAVSEADLDSDAGQTILLGARHSSGPSQGMDLVLIDIATRKPVGLAPGFLQHPRTTDEYEGGIKDLYDGLALHVTGLKSHVLRVDVDTADPAAVPGFAVANHTRTS